VEKEAVEGNMLVLMAKAGKASLLNLAQMSGFVGQQALRGKRIHIGYNQRALPHFRKGDLSSKARGFVRHSYTEGLDPVEAWFNAVVGRDSYIDTAVRTPKSGYMQRRLINALQDLKTNYDATVRDSGEKIIQFTYGEDNVDVSKSKQGDIV
jgi:DNA-directed RNA polymerase subunit A'